jgi:hypothetical protein
MKNPVAASAIDLSLFEIDTHSRQVTGSYEIASARHIRTYDRVTIKTFLFHPPEGER